VIVGRPLIARRRALLNLNAKLQGIAPYGYFETKQEDFDGPGDYDFSKAEKNGAD
jgi:hypothetical protein